MILRILQYAFLFLLFLPSECASDACDLSEEFRESSLIAVEGSSTNLLPVQNSGHYLDSKSLDPLDEGTILFLPNTFLDRQAVGAQSFFPGSPNEFLALRFWTSSYNLIVWNTLSTFLVITCYQNKVSHLFPTNKWLYYRF